MLEQDESFYLAMVSPFEVDISAHTEDERITIKQYRWWSHDDLRHTGEWIWPQELVELWSLAGEPSPGRSSLVPRRSRPSSTSTDRAKDRD